MINVSVPNLDAVLNELSKELSKVTTDKFVTVGVHQDDNARPDDTMTNAQIGALNHFGTENIPAAPWLDVGVASVSQEIIDTVDEGIEDGESMDIVLNRVGLVAVAGVQDYMDELRTPSNAPSTIAKKGADNRLIDTAELKQSVTYKITNTKPSEGI